MPFAFVTNQECFPEKQEDLLDGKMGGVAAAEFGHHVEEDDSFQGKIKQWFSTIFCNCSPEICEELQLNIVDIGGQEEFLG